MESLISLSIIGDQTMSESEIGFLTDYVNEFLEALESGNFDKYESAKQRQFVEMFANQMSNWAVEILRQYEFPNDGERDVYQKFKDILKVAYFYARR